MNYFKPKVFLLLMTSKSLIGFPFTIMTTNLSTTTPRLSGPPYYL